MSQKKLGLALGSGGWRGIAHVGVLKALLRHGVRIDAIAGTSAGALAGAFYAALNDIGMVEKIFRENMNYRRVLFAFSDPRPRGGLFRGEKINQLFEQYLTERSIEQLKIPFCAVACDLITGKAVELKKGPLTTAIRASIAVPFFLQPVPWESMQLIDGGTVLPVPVSTVKNMGSEVVIAVNLQKNQFPMHEYRSSSAFNVALKASQILTYHLSEYTQKDADLVLKPDIDERKNISDPFSGFVNRDDLFSVGENIVEENWPKIERLLQ